MPFLGAKVVVTSTSIIGNVLCEMHLRLLEKAHM